MSCYSVMVKGLETYDVIAKNERQAISKAIDYFKDDDEWYGSPETEDVRFEDCEIMFVE